MSASAVLSLLGALVGLVAIMLVAGRLLQLRPFRVPVRPGQTLIWRESIALDPKRRLHLIQCGQQKLILLTGGSTDMVVGWLPEP